MFFDVGDLFRPGGNAFVGDSGGVLAFRFGEGLEGVLQSLLQGGPGHMGRLSPRVGYGEWSLRGDVVRKKLWDRGLR